MYDWEIPHQIVQVNVDFLEFKTIFEIEQNV